MIVEKRRRIRKLKPAEKEWIPEPDFVEIEHWGDIRLPDVTSKRTLILKGMAAALLGFLIGKIFFLD
jgi:hypothetical protein